MISISSLRANNLGEIQWSLAAEKYQCVTVMFIDIVGFTKQTFKDDSDMVYFLNNFITELDNLTAKFNIEKLKTIGDCYMAVSGCPIASENHAEQMALFALEASSFIQENNKKSKNPFYVRMGMHSGPVISGVLGEVRRAWDIFGETVNMASRMEQSGKTGKMQVSSKCYSLLANRFKFEANGLISIKNMGDEQTYFLSGLLPNQEEAITEDKNLREEPLLIKEDSDKENFRLELSKQRLSSSEKTTREALQAERVPRKEKKEEKNIEPFFPKLNVSSSSSRRFNQKNNFKKIPHL